MSKIKEILKNSKSIKKSDEILDDLFNSIKEVKGDSSESNSEEEKDSEDSDSVSEDRKERKKKKSKKKKKQKKKKKKHRRNETSEEKDEVSTKKTKSDKEQDVFWGNSKPFQLGDSGKGEQSSKEKDGKERRRKERSSDKDRGREERSSDKERGRENKSNDKERGRYERLDSNHSERREMPKIEYNDERKPIDLGREAKPYPTAQGEDFRRTEYSSGGRVYNTGYAESDSYYRGNYDRDKWVREEYDRSGNDGIHKEKREEYYRSREERSDNERSREERSGHERHGGKEKGKGGKADGFWDTKWDAMQLDERLEKAEKKGRYYLNTKKRFQDATGDKEGTPSLSPSPERKKKKKEESSDESDTEELKRLKKLKDIQNLKVDGDGLVVGPVADSANYEYDKVTRMYRKKDGMIEVERKRLVKEISGKLNEEKVQISSKPVKINKKTISKENSENDYVMDELVKEIEELENEVENQEKDVTSEVKPVSTIDWSDSALSHLKDDKKIAEEVKKKDEKKEGEIKDKNKEEWDKKDKKKKEGEKKDRKKEDEGGKDIKLEDGEVEEEDGEISSDDSKTKSRSSSKKRKSRSRSKRSPYSRDKRQSYDRSSRRRSRSYERSSFSSRKSRSPYDRRGGSSKNERRYSSRNRYDRRSRSRDRRSRSRERAEDRYERNKRRQDKHMRSKVNKEKLLEIAKKNAAKILKSGGDFMGMDQDRLIAMKSGGQSLDELTRFCKEIAKKGLEDSNKIEMLAESESSDEEEFHHPFMVKDRPLPNPITMLIGESRETLPPAARAVAKSHRMLEFPVSSGNAHRSKEVGVPEDPLGEWEEADKQVAEVMKKDEDEMLKFHEQIEQEEKELKESAAKAALATNPETEESKPWTLNEEDKDLLNPRSDMFKLPIKDLSAEQQAELEKLRPKHASGLALTGPSERLALPVPPIAEPAISSDPNKVFDTANAPIVDIGTIVSKRLNAMRKLQANPEDSEALQEMYEAQKHMTSWATSKNKPGQFVGSTGAKILSRHELNLGVQCWAKKEQFLKAEKVKGGFGEFMLKKMGWSDGEGLGKNKSGDVNPLTLDIKFDKKGLMAAEEDKTKVIRVGNVVTLTACKDLSGKHPISALTELCSKRRWGPPIFTQAFECGPPHKKQYIFKVNVNGTDYTPSVAVDNKKKAKAMSAMACLQQMGLVPKDPDNPV